VREWELGPEDPISLVIAADARTTQPNYADDQIWELKLGDGEPAALALETNYGLRARGMRIFPGFRLGDETRLDPEAFDRPPRLHTLLPDYLRLSCAPFRGLEVIGEYWVPASNLVAGRFHLRNRGSEPIQLTLLLHAILRSDDLGQPLRSQQQQGAMVLAGRTGDLQPLVFLSGGASAAISPYPALAIRPRLVAGGGEIFTWAQAACREAEESFRAVRELVTRPWDAEVARIEQLNAGTVEIETGNPDWDVAFAMSQRTCLGLTIGPTRHLPHPSPVLVRSPSQGYSARGDGRDYELGWDGLTAAQAWVYLAQILPAAPELAKGVLLNFLSGQNPDGSVDWKPGPGGQRAGMQSIPLLATLAWRIFQHTEDRDFLDRTFARLLNYLEVWRERRYDRDQDGHPEWDHTRHAGFDDWPSFVRWQRWGQGAELRLAETPDLLAFLVREVKALLAIATELGRQEEQPELLAWLSELERLADRCWSEASGCYLPLDRELHVSAAAQKLGRGRGEFTRRVGKSYDPPVRVLVRVLGDGSAPHPVQVFIHGRGRTPQRRVERISGRRFQWFDGLGTATTEKLYSRIDRIEVRGLKPSFRIELLTPDHTRLDYTGLLPLWAGLPDPRRAATLIDENLSSFERFWSRHGVRSWPADDPAYDQATVMMLPNLLLGEALVAYGRLEEAAELVGGLMRACIHSLKHEHAFRETYRPDEPGGAGPRHHLLGVAPLSLFLEVLGVRLISPDKVSLRGTNPFPWPVSLRWRGLTIHWQADRAKVTFSSGEQAEVNGPEVQVVERIAEPASA
jgi:hypothetical protein